LDESKAWTVQHSSKVRYGNFTVQMSEVYSL